MHKYMKGFVYECKPCRRATRLNTPKVEAWPDGFKRCNNCKKLKPVDQFSPNKRGRLGKESHCKPCKTAYVMRKIAKMTQDEKADFDAKRREAMKERYARKRDEILDYQRKRKSKEPDAYTAEEFRAKLEHYGGRCHWCWKKIEGTPHADHLIPKSKGGSWRISNIVPSCAHCNLSKHARLPHEFNGRLL